MPTGLELLAQSLSAPKRQARDPLAPIADEAEGIPVEEGAEVDPVLPKNQGAFLSGLQWIGRFGQVGKNLAGAALGTEGSLEGAARQGADILGEAVDAVVPGDWIPQASRPQDEVTGASVLGLSKEWQKEHPLLAIGAGLPVDLALDPITYVPGAALGKVAGAIGRTGAAVASKVPGGANALASLGKGASSLGMAARSIAGAQRLSPLASEAVGVASAAKANEAKAGLSAIAGSKALSSLTPEEGNIVGDLIDGFKWEGNKLAGELVPGSTSAFERIGAHPGVTPQNVERITQGVKDALEIGQNQATRKGISNELGPSEEYLGRKYTGQTEEQVINEALGSGPAKLGAPGVTKSRTLEGAEEVAGHLERNPGVKFERNAIARLAQRAQAQGTLAGRAEIGRKLLGDAFELTDDAQRGQVTETIRKMAETDPESAKVLHDTFHGLPPRGPLMDSIAKVNRVIKPALVFGYGIPKIGSIIRNKISGIWQAGSNPAARGVALEQAKRLPSDLYGAVVDSLGLRVPKDQLGHAGDLIENAFRQSKGSADQAAGFLATGPGAGGYTGQELADVVKSGAISGFVSSEDIIQSMAKSPQAKAWKSFAEWPARMFKGIEDRMRTGMALDLLRKGKSADEVGKIVSDSLYSYDITSAGNRAIRDVIPFGQFVMKAGVQQADLLKEKPWLAVALSSLLTEKEGQPTYGYMGGKLNIPLGTNESGEVNYASGLGLPFEALTQIPNLSGSIQESGREIGRTLVGSGQPLLKTAASLAFGNDPTFGTTPGSYSKLPGNIEGGAVGRAYNILAGTGLISPVSEPLRQIGKVFDDRRDIGTKALDLLSGVNITTVNPDKALQQRLTAYLRNNPDVASVESLYSKSTDPEAQALIRQLAEAKRRIKASREAATSAP